MNKNMILTKITKEKNKQYAVDWLRYVLFFFNFKSNHVILRPDAVGNNVWLHAAAFVVIGFNIPLVLGPTRLQCYFIYSISA